MKRFKYLKGLVLTLILANASQASAAAGFSDIYVLGDSLSDQGNLFNATEVLVGTGNPDADHYYMGRFSDDENYADELAARLGLDLTPSNYGGNNFAYGGTRTDYNRVEGDITKPFPVNYLGQGGTFPKDEYPWSLDGQSEAFADLEIYDPDALYVVFSGANDLSDLISMVARCQLGYDVFCAGRGDPAVAIPVMLSGISNAIAAFVASGAQDIIVPNMPNLGVVPSVTEFGPDFAGLATWLSYEYNEALNEMLTTWEGQVNIIRFDTYSLLTEVVNNPPRFGFLNANDACYSGFVAPPGPGEEVGVCDEPSTYVFWDKEHPTTAFHVLMADFMLAAASEDILDDLMDWVAVLDLPTGVKRSLMAKLEAAQRKLEDDSHYNDRAASGVLKAFVNSVNAQAGKKIAVDDAAMLIKRAELVLYLLAVD